MRSFRLTFAAVCALAILGEAYLLFGDRDSEFSIEGVKAYTIAAFAAGEPVSHAFLMRGEGLQSVSVRFDSSAAAAVRVKWTLWRGYPDVPKEMSRAFEGVESLDLRPGPQWVTFSFTRDGSSKDRWYTIQVQLLDPRPAPFPQVSIVASRDNPDRGGVLFVNDIRQPGSLYIRAERRGRTLYRRFLAEAAPNLPPALRIPAVQWGIAIVLHWALVVFAYAVLVEGVRSPSREGAR